MTQANRPNKYMSGDSCMLSSSGYEYLRKLGVKYSFDWPSHRGKHESKAVSEQSAALAGSYNYRAQLL